jgi:hypothetical protein
VGVAAEFPNCHLHKVGVQVVDGEWEAQKDIELLPPHNGPEIFDEEMATSISRRY